MHASQYKGLRYCTKNILELILHEFKTMNLLFWNLLSSPDFGLEFIYEFWDEMGENVLHLKIPTLNEEI